MGEFSAQWLALREGVDHAARSSALATWIVETLPRDQPIRILDLACGTGSNLRYLTKWGRGYFPPPDIHENIPVPISWLLVDEDAALLANVPAAPGVTTQQQNLATLTADLFRGRTLVTASALLDLVSAEWLHALVSHCRAARAAALFALTYDGRIECTPAEPEDALVRNLVNQHQHTDKGLGSALGPDASAFVAQSFAAAGYEVRTERSDWVLDRSGARHQLQRELITGWADAAAETAPEQADAIADWERRRLDHVETGRSRIVVGHQDLAARIG